MTDLFNIGSSALLSYKRALDTVGHNIANATTAGYTRQRVEFAALEGQGSGFGFVGAGVEATRIARLLDGFSNDRVTASTADLGRANVLAEISGSLDRLMSDESTGLQQPLRSFIDAVDGVAADPSSAAARGVLLSSAESLASQFRSMSEQLDRRETDISGRMSATLSQINGLSDAIARINDDIVTQRASFGQEPNDLLDRRDEMVRMLSDKVGVTTVMQSDGALNVFADHGQPLVLGTQASQLSMSQDPWGGSAPEIMLNAPTGNVPITRQLNGGELGGLLDARRELIDPVRSEIGRLAASVTELANSAQAAGSDQYGQAGAALFSTSIPHSAAHRTNTGTASLALSLPDASQLTGANYVLSHDGAAWQLRESGSGAPVSFTGSGSVADPLSFEGLEIVVSGTPAAGDRFFVQSSSGLAADISVALRDPAGIAAAQAVGVQADGANAGLATPRVLVDDPAHPDIRSAAVIEFAGAGSYSINGGPPVAYAPGDNIIANGWRVTLDGAPAAGDRFMIAATPPSSGDNGNVRGLADALRGGLLDGGLTSLQQAHSQLVSRTGSRAQQAELVQSATSAILDRDLADRDAVAGVNLDEEAADLLRYEQAYQAAARVITTADNLFQTLLSAVGRG